MGIRRQAVGGARPDAAAQSVYLRRPRSHADTYLALARRPALSTADGTDVSSGVKSAAGADADGDLSWRGPRHPPAASSCRRPQTYPRLVRAARQAIPAMKPPATAAPPFRAGLQPTSPVNGAEEKCSGSPVYGA